jgi:hypothetical protein
MILTAHQPVYLPWLGLFHKIALSDEYCYLDSVQYQKNDWNNRNKIKTAQGPLWLTVPILTEGHLDKKFPQIEIDNTKDWRKKHWLSIKTNYQKAPYFKKYAPFFEDVYSREWTHLSELNEYMLKWFLQELGISVKFSKASELHLKEAKSDLVLEMCQKLDADTFIFGALGKDYAKEEDFTAERIQLYFQEYNPPTYPQLYGEFAPYMSIVDLLFNCGERSLEVLMSGNLTKDELTNCAHVRGYCKDGYDICGDCEAILGKSKKEEDHIPWL